MNEGILDLSPKDIPVRRRDLLPLWIKVFIWIFLIFGAMVPLVLVLALFGIPVNLSLYGLEVARPASALGLLIILLFMLKSAVSLGLWTEKEWAVDLAVIDGVIGIVVNVVIMFILPVLYDGFGTSIRLELLVLIPYVVKMRRIKEAWKQSAPLVSSGGVEIP
ncbi:hypothetical protein [Flavilitoribacter nigricans]|uniref:Uncharacterized protein n=1 Tax=Flavilitoribacter nigricans (strain ATCC 23147 / DSM 23189 / NBRC 102662 / NCIMB 1420 / SS-2) TaxID=1122177 RepID=A0A2D0N068_FLAN2|nr:hypothetical protein [Flavilitoribacter nigricans]PHN01778.1 hypothetical protein CRP01_35420 [Flavilitoribacter nigricans DSM 23189 = NBRC 102662]